MEFSVEYYETESGKRPVEEFIDELFASDPGDAASIFAGLQKLKQRSNHRSPLTKAIGKDLFELRHVGKLNTRVFWFYVKGRRIIAVHGIRNKGQKIPTKDRNIALERKADWERRNPQ